MEHTSVDSTNGQSCTHEAEIFNNLHDNIGTESVHLNTFTNEQASMHFEFGCDVGENVGNVRSESHALWDFGETNAFKLHDKVDDKSPNPFTGTYNVTLEPICNEELHNIQSNEYGKITLDELDGKDDARSNLPSPCLPHPASEEAQRPFSDETLNARVTPKDNPCADAQPLFCEQSQHSVSQEIESFLGEAEGQFSSQNNGRNHVQSKHTSILNCSSMPFTTAVPMVCTQMQSATATKLLPAAQNHNHVSNSSGDTVSPQALCGDMVSCFTMDKNHVENVAAVGKQRNICSRRALQTCNEIHLPLQAAHWENHRQTAAKRQIRRTIRKAMRTKAIEKNNIETGNRGQKQPIHLEPLAPSNVQQSSQNPLSSQNISTAAPDNTILPVRKVPNTSQDCPTVVVSPAAAHSVQVSPKLPKSSGKGIESTDPKTGMRRSVSISQIPHMCNGIVTSYTPVCPNLPKLITF